MYVVELRNVSKQGTALWNVALELRPGEVLSLSGSRDAARLARILSLDDDSWSGEFFLLGTPVHELASADRRDLRRSEIGVVFTDDRLIPELTVYENLEIPLTFRTRRGERDRLMEPLMESLELSELLSAYPRSLSRRETQLVKIARASIGNPSLFIADNLSSCLRPADWMRVREVLRRLLARGTVVALTRDAEKRAVEADSAREERTTVSLAGAQASVAAL